MNAIEPRHQAGEAAQPPVADAAPAPVTAPAPELSPEVEVPSPRRNRKAWIADAIAIVALAAVAYWKRAALPALFDLVPPYSSAIAFVLLGIIGAFYKDNYRHTAAKWSAVTIMVISGFLMGVNTYKDRAARAQEKIDRAKEKNENTKTSDGIIKSVDKISGELKDFNDKVKPDEIRGEMASLKSTMDKVINPQRATMLFTLVPYPDPAVLGGPITPVRDIDLPLNPDGSVHVRFTFINNSNVVAETMQVALEICRGCRFAKEPEGFTRIPGSRDTERNHMYGDAPASGAVADLAADIIPPANTAAFKIRLRYRCKTCVLEANGTEGTIHIQRN